MARKFTDAQANENASSLPSPMTRREFLAGAAASVVIGPTLLRAAARPPGRQTLLHVDSHNRHNGHVHTYPLTSAACKRLSAIALALSADLPPQTLVPVLDRA